MRDNSGVTKYFVPPELFIKIMKQYLKIVLMSLILLVLFAGIPMVSTYAQTTTRTNTSTGGSNSLPAGDKVQGGLNAIKESFPDTVVDKASTFSDLVKTIIDYALYLAAIIAVIFIIIGGYMYITSAGKDDQAKNGRKTLANALIGLVIVVLSYVIVQVVYELLIKS